MGLDLVPDRIRELYEVHEWKHACAILRHDFSAEFDDIIQVLGAFRLRRSHIIEPGGRKSPMAIAMDTEFYKRGWQEKDFDTRVKVDEKETRSPTHSVDCFKNGVALEIEWNNKDPFYDGI